MVLTRKTESRAARAVISEHETTLPQLFSNRPRILSMILKASALKVKFGGASFSLGPLADPSNKTDPSHPYMFKLFRSRHDVENNLSQDIIDKVKYYIKVNIYNR